MKHFDPTPCYIRADEALSRPHPRSHVQRAEPAGELVARFALPLELCKPQNRTNHRKPWAYQADRKRVAEIMGFQAPKARAPLPGRPLVRCIRFSSVEPDAFSDWAKMAVDVLTLPNGRAPNRLGYLRDDRPADADVRQWWEPAKRGDGFVVIEVWTGAESDRRSA